MEDSHLKVRTHAAHALRTVRDAGRAYGDQLAPVLGGSLRGLRACKQRSIVADPTQMRQVTARAAGGEGGRFVSVVAWCAIPSCSCPSALVCAVCALVCCVCRLV